MPGVNSQIRVGSNTGEVVLRSIRKDNLHTDYVPVGQSTHLWFTEGFDTKDLQEAKALLEELKAS